MTFAGDDTELISVCFFMYLIKLNVSVSYQNIHKVLKVKVLVIKCFTLLDNDYSCIKVLTTLMLQLLKMDLIVTDIWVTEPDGSQYYLL